MADLLALSERLLGATNTTQGTSTKNTTRTRYIKATATTDSANGEVTVDIGGETMPVSVTGNVKNGDTVPVLVQNGKVVGLGGIGQGDVIADKVKYIDTLVANNITADELSADHAYIDALEAADITADNITADKADIAQLKADVADIDTLVAKKADISDLEANYAHITNGTIDNAHIEWADVDNAKIQSANIDSAVVNELLGKSAIISDAVVGDQSVTGTLTGIKVSANDLTAGKIDAAEIEVVNLNAANITVGTINGQQIAQGAIDVGNLDSSIQSSLAQIPELQAVADNAIESWTGSGVPTTTNEPAMEWVTNALKKQHAGDLYYDTDTGYSYRWAEVDGSYCWTLIKDTDVTKAIQDAQAAQDTADSALAAANSGITKVEVQYAQNQSTSTAPTSGWSATAPTWKDGYYIWQRTVTTYKNGNTSTSTATCISGAKGATGATGAQGAKGDKGDTGATGATGAAGKDGVGYKANLLLGTSEEWSSWYTPTEKNNNTWYIYATKDASFGKNGAKLSCSFDIEFADVTASSSGTFRFYTQEMWTNVDAATINIGTWNTGPFYGALNATAVPADGVYHYEHTTTLAKDLTGQACLRFVPRWDWPKTGKFRVRKVMLNEGTEPAEWSLAASELVGTGVSAITPQYYLSSSNTTQTGGSWVTTCPVWSTGKYIWTRSACKWTDNTTTYTTPVLDNGLNLASENAATALANAKKAQTTADGKNKVFVQSSTPEATAQGDLWRVTDADGNIITENVWNGSAWVAHALTGSSLIVPGSVTATTIADGAITTDKVAANAITAAKITSGAVTADKVAANAIAAGNIQSSAITSDKIAADAIKATHLDSECVTADAIAANAITSAKIAAGAVKADSIDSGAVTAAKISVNDLSALGATIGGNHIGTEGIYSGDKSSYNAASSGFYLGKDGAVGIGSGTSGLTYDPSSDTLAIKAKNFSVDTNPVVLSSETQFYQSSSATALSGGSWSTTTPTWTAGKYIWTRDKVTYSDGTIGYTPNQTGVCITGATGATGAKGADGTMLYATCSTAASTAAKIATLGAGTLTLTKGATVSVYFTYANTAASPTLNVSSTGAKAIRTNGTAYCYWVAGTAVTFTYDGTYWQCCSAPVYASTATIGNPRSKNVYIDGTDVDIRNGTTNLATFGANSISLGQNSTSSTVNMCGGKMNFRLDSSSSWQRGYIENIGTSGIYPSINLCTQYGSTAPTYAANVSSNSTSGSSYASLNATYGDLGAGLAMWTIGNDIRYQWTARDSTGSYQREIKAVDFVNYMLEPKVLYNNSSGGQGTIYLAEKVTNFESLFITFGYADGLVGGCWTYTNCANTFVDLNSTMCLSSPTGRIFRYRITLTGAVAYQTVNDAAYFGSNWMDYISENKLYIYRIVGMRKANSY